MQQATHSTPQRDRKVIPGEAYSEKGAVAIAGVWLAFYAIIGVASVVARLTPEMASLAAID